MELFIKRGIAFLIDYMIILLPTGISILFFGIIKWMISVLPFLGGLSDFIWLSGLSFVIYLMYEVFCLMFFSRTLGKIVMGLYVRKNSGESLDFLTILIRSVFKTLFVSGYLFWMIIINMLLVLGQDEHKSVHDWIAGTSIWKN
jgi:uncharacterized RDD family membrane protein YckC